MSTKSKAGNALVDRLIKSELKPPTLSSCLDSTSLVDLELSGGLQMHKIQNPTNANQSGEKFSLPNIKVAIFAFSGGVSKPLIDELSPFFGNDRKRFLSQLGLFYFTGVGQGENYHRGFYGPLPMPNETEYVSFVFATMIPDQAQLDPRLGGQDYVLVCLVCHKTHVPKFMDRLDIEATFNNIFAAVEDVREIDFALSNCLKLVMISATEYSRDLP
ncbi:MAG: hypothetical protein ACE5OZ_12680 [Candidatus Heimdallarchaeota archaeon]